MSVDDIPPLAPFDIALNRLQWADPLRWLARGAQDFRRSPATIGHASWHGYRAAVGRPSAEALSD